jgi:hypothetical protein
MGYDIAYEYLAKQGRECSQGFELNKLLEKTPNLFDIRVSKHMACVKNGVLEDTYNSYPFKCVYTAFKVE